MVRRRLQRLQSLAARMPDGSLRRLLTVRPSAKFGRTIEPRYSLNLSAIEQYSRVPAARHQLCNVCGATVYEGADIPRQPISRQPICECCPAKKASEADQKGVTADTLFEGETVSPATPQPNTLIQPKAQLASEPQAPDAQPKDARGPADKTAEDDVMSALGGQPQFCGQDGLAVNHDLREPDHGSAERVAFCLLSRPAHGGGGLPPPESPIPADVPAPKETTRLV